MQVVRRTHPGLAHRAVAARSDVLPHVCQAEPSSQHARLKAGAEHVRTEAAVMRIPPCTPFPRSHEACDALVVMDEQHRHGNAADVKAGIAG